MIWEKLSFHSFATFLLIFTISSIPSMGNSVSVGEDIADQVRSSLHWFQGKVVAPNYISHPQGTDLSVDQNTWSIRPPGAAFLPLLGLLAGCSLGQSIQIGLFCCMLVGSYGWLFIFQKFKVHKHLIFIMSIMLGFSAGNSISSYISANIILFALVPWFILFVMIISNHYNKFGLTVLNIFTVTTFLFLLGGFAWIKLSGLIVSGTIGACLFFTLLKRTKSRKKLRFVIAFGIMGISFWLPFLLLEKLNVSLTGVTADQFYGGNDSDIQAPLFGKYWGNSTKGIWLLWSFVCALGYVLPVKEFAHGLRDLMLQFDPVIQFLNQMMVNEHVLFCGIIGLVFTIMLILESKKCWPKLECEPKVYLICFLTLPFIGLGILSFKYGWNYLMFHAHTAEYWLIYTVPILITFSATRKIQLSSILFLGVVVALPLCNSIQFKLTHLKKDKAEYLSKTDKALGLSNSRFSKAINYIEQDTKNRFDIIYFLPSGDTGDLVLRTKMRTMATHFAGDNFLKVKPLQTSKKLNIYLTYDTSLDENPEFIEARSKKFPNSISKNIIYKGPITINQLELSPQS